MSEGRVGLLRAECKDLEREGTEGCGAQTGWVNFEKNIILLLLDGRGLELEGE